MVVVSNAQGPRGPRKDRTPKINRVNSLPQGADFAYRGSSPHLEGDSREANLRDALEESNPGSRLGDFVEQTLTKAQISVAQRSGDNAIKWYSRRVIIPPSLCPLPHSFQLLLLLRSRGHYYI